MKYLIRLFPALAIALVLTGCSLFKDTTIQQRAYAVGQSYNLVQKGAITYLQVGHPSPDVANKIADADSKASPQVQAALNCAADLIDPKGDDMAAKLGLDADQVAEAKTEACEATLSRANQAAEDVSNALKGN